MRRFCLRGRRAGGLQGEQVLKGFGPRLHLSAGRLVTDENRKLDSFAEAIANQSCLVTKNMAQRLNTLNEKTRLLDPARLLARGYSLTRTEAGVVLKSQTEVAAGQKINTVFHDGEIMSIVQIGNQNTHKTPAKGTKSGSKSQKNSGQKTLFR